MSTERHQVMACALDRSQRWRARRAHFVPNTSTINPTDYSVDVIEEAAAKAFVVEHHYSGSFPAARLNIGLFHGRDLAGVAVFSQPMNEAAVPKHTRLGPGQGVDLGRFVLLDDVAGNGETWFLSRAFRALRQMKPGVLSVVSYADPVPRLSADGGLVKPGHIGMIYQALGALYRGRGTPRTELLTPDGQPLSERARSKIRQLDCGYAYAIDELVRRGAPKPDLAEDPRTWLAGLLASGFFQRRRHPGNHVYTFPLTQAARIAGRGIVARPYPMKEAA